MASFNKVFLMGNLSRDPELAYTSANVAVCKLGLAVNNSYIDSQGNKKEDPLFIDIVVWKKQAENCATYLGKGRPIFVEGRLQLDKWEKDGQKHSKIKVVAQSVKFIGEKPENGNKPERPQESPQEFPDEDMPF